MDKLWHSTGHARRLNRHSKFPNHKFGSADYSQEELVAEMGAAYLCGVCGIENETIDNSAAYIDSWLQKLKNDKKFVLQAASYAQLAADCSRIGYLRPDFPDIYISIQKTFLIGVLIYPISRLIFYFYTASSCIG